MSDRPPPDIERGPHRELPPLARRLVDRAAARDRAAAADQRVAAVRQEEARIRSRERTVRWISWGLAAVALVGLGVVARGAVGGIAGVGLLLVAGAVKGSLRRAAERRGASAWDWRARRYRLLGDPSAEVQNLDGYGDTRDALGQRKPRR